ncbi:MAG: hypothetical protein ABIG84_04975 [archaeon]
MKRFAYSYLSALLILILLTQSSHADNPIPYLIEEATQELFTNGTVKTPLTAEGRLEISVPNTPDVLQYVRINISSDYIGKTNIQSQETFADVAASPLPQDRSPIYIDTTGGYDIRYNITDHNVFPQISLKLTHNNAEGGKDIHSGAPNTLSFNLTITSDKTPANPTYTDLYFKIKDNTYAQDSMVLGAPAATSSITLQALDTDGDTYADTIYWRGDLTAGTPVYITFPGTTQANVNYNRGDQYVDIDEIDATRSVYSKASSFTGITITSRFSRGPIRQGLRMLFKDSVWLRGTITNKAHGITYSLTDWALYNVTDLLTPIASGVVPAPQQLAPGETYETQWFITPNFTEKYFVSEFNWRVRWAPSSYLSTATTAINLPTLYQADGVSQKTISLVQITPARILNIEDSARHMGHSSLYFNATTITSTVPVGYTIEDINVYYSNITVGGSEYNITSNVTINITANVLKVTIEDISKILRKQLGLNEDLIIRYQATGPTTPADYTFASDNTFILNTTSGTPLTLTSSGSVLLPGTEPPAPPAGPGGGAGGGFINEFASIEKLDSLIVQKEQPDTAEVKAVFRIIDIGNKGVGDIYAKIILPKDSILDEESINVSTYNPITKKWTTYTEKDLIIKKDTAIINNTISYSVKIKSTNWDEESFELNLNNNELYSITYSAKLTLGSNELTTRLLGFNYYTDEQISKDIEAYIRIIHDEIYISELEIRESEFQPQQIIVGKPPRWLKTIDVYNPNTVSVSHEFRIGLFPEVISSHISTENRELDHNLDSRDIVYAVFKDTIREGQKKTYLIDITTPPILITDEKYTIDRYDSTKLIFTTNLTLENPSSIDYENIMLIYPIGRESIIKVLEDGKDLKFASDNPDQIKIEIPRIKKKSSTTISLYYIKTPPVLTASVDKPSYTSGEKVNISVVFIPHENMSSSFIQIEVLENAKDPETIYAEIEQVNNLKESTPYTLSREFTTPAARQGEYIVHAAATLSPLGQITDTTTFHIESNLTTITKLSFKLMLLFVLVILLLLIKRIYKRKEFVDEIRSLKKEIEKL